MKKFLFFMLLVLLLDSSFFADAVSGFIYQEGHGDHIIDYSFSGDGKWFASSEDSCIKIWEVESGKLLRTIDADSAGISLNNDGNYLLYTIVKYPGDHTTSKVMLYDVVNDTTSVFEDMTVYQEWASSAKASFSPSGKYVFIRGRIYDFASRKIILSFSCGSSKQIVWKPDEKKIVVGATEYSVLTGKQTARFSAETSNYDLPPVAYSKNGDYIAVGNKEITVLDSQSYGSLSKINTGAKYKYNYGRSFVSFDCNDNIHAQKDGVFDLFSGKKLYGVSGLCDPQGNVAAVFDDMGAVSFYDTRTMKSKNNLAGKFDNILLSSYSPFSKSLLLSTAGGKTLLFDTENFSLSVLGQTKNIYERYQFANNESCSKGGRYVSYRNLAGDICVYDIKAKKELFVFEGTSAFEKTAAFACDGSCFYASSKDKLRVWELKKGKLVKEILYNGKFTNGFGKVVYIPKYGRILNLSSEYFHGKLEALDGRGNFVKYLSIRQVDDFYYNDVVDSIDVLYDAGIGLYNANSLELEGSIGIEVPRGNRIASSNDGVYVGIISYGSFCLYDRKSLKLACKIDVGDAEYADMNLHFSDDSKYAYTVTNKGFKIWSVKKQKLLATAIVVKDGDWLLYTPEGYYCGTDWAIKNLVHLSKGKTIIGIEQFAEVLFRQDLVLAKIRDDSSDVLPIPNISALAASGDAPVCAFVNPPNVSSSRDVTLSFSVEDMGGGIGAVYLSLNGKIVQVADESRSLSLDGAEKSKKMQRTEYQWVISLQNGDNAVEVFAMNAAGKIEGVHAACNIKWQGATSKPSLYVLAVGVNQYRDGSLRLKYSVPDATGVAQAFQKIKGKLYQSVNVVTLIDENVNSDGLKKTFDSISAKVTADDVFIFYLSGHGTTHDGDYYFIPVDFRYRDSSSVVNSAVSKQFLQDNLRKIKAQKTLVVLDTCNSGAFISGGARGMSDKTAVDRLSRSTGQAIISASTDSQVAMEGYSGHGILTYVMLNGLSGKADSNGDGFVSLQELSSYIGDQVPELSFKKWNYEQIPWIELKKQDFPLVGK